MLLVNRVTASAARTRSDAWKFRSRLRRSAFGWRGTQLAIKRLTEALTEIRAVSRRDGARAAEGAVLFLEKISPAVRDVDSSSGALGSAVHAAVQELVPVIAAAIVNDATRDKWLDRLYEAIQEDDPPYIESLGDAWGDLCVTVERASRWADELLPTVKHVFSDRKQGRFGWFCGTSLCYSALFKADRHDELLDLLAQEGSPAIWHSRLWGGRVLAVRGQIDAAIAYMERGDARYQNPGALARFAEDALLAAGRRQEAYEKYAISANQGTSYISTYRAVAKKYPEIDPDRVLRDLIASTPGEEGKWFATAKTLKRFDTALELARKSPTDPKTLVRAATAHVSDQPLFAAQAAILALHWIALGYGYEIAGVEVIDAMRAGKQAASRIGLEDKIDEQIAAILSRDGTTAHWMRQFAAMAEHSTARMVPSS